MQKTTNGKESVISLVGLLSEILVCFVLLAGASSLLLSGKVGEESEEILVSVIVLVTSLAGNWISARNNADTILSVSISTAAMVLMMLVGGLIMEGQFENVLLRIGAAIAGGALACVICLKKNGKHFKRKRRHR